MEIQIPAEYILIGGTLGYAASVLALNYYLGHRAGRRLLQRAKEFAARVAEEEVRTGRELELLETRIREAFPDASIPDSDNVAPRQATRPHIEGNYIEQTYAQVVQELYRCIYGLGYKTRNSS